MHLLRACAWRAVFFALILLPRGHCADSTFRYRTYRQINEFFHDLQRKYPDIVEVWYAQELFPEILPQKTSWGTCEGEPCKTLIVRITNKQKLTDFTPEVFFSGALHGDERIGPATVTELAAFLCEQYVAKHPEVVRLVDLRATWLMPMTNAHGYANNRREENAMDPNRDFPYLQKPDRCMRTQTARAVNELFRRHLFQFMITFHGGMRALTYEWGSKNHMARLKSTESPDETAFKQVGESLQAAAGRDRRQRWFYPLGRINDLVYPVDGGMEDWSYAAGWEKSPQPITVCSPTSYGGYAQDRTRYHRGSISTLVYLAEMDDAKRAPETTLGHSRDIWSVNSYEGHISRNMRMCLKLIELTRPEIVVRQAVVPSALGPDVAVATQVSGFGCYQVTARLLMVPAKRLPHCDVGVENGADFEDAAFQEILTSTTLASANHRCQGLTVWGAPEVSFQLEGKLPKNSQGEVCLLIAAEFDSQWSRQVHPDPSVQPRSHAARVRLEERYEAQASDGSKMIRARRTKIFAIHDGPLAIRAAKVAEAPEVPQTPLHNSEAPDRMPPSSPWQDQVDQVPVSSRSGTEAAKPHLRQPSSTDPKEFALTLPLYAVASLAFLLTFSAGLINLACKHSQAPQDKADADDAMNEGELAKIVGQRQPAD